LPQRLAFWEAQPAFPCGLPRSRADIKPSLAGPKRERARSSSEVIKLLSEMVRDEESRQALPRARYDDARTDLTRSAKRLNLPRRKDTRSSRTGCFGTGCLIYSVRLEDTKENGCDEIYIVSNGANTTENLLQLLLPLLS